MTTAAVATGPPTGGSFEPSPGSHIAGLDGIRGLAALYVVIHHCYLASFPEFPRGTGPWWTGWMIYGHLAVVVFIVLSGYSLAVSPARHGWRLGSLTRFAHRRAWRILSAYWPALALSIAAAWVLVPQPGEDLPTVRSTVVYGLLLQDVTWAPSPNGAFWSIAIEAQLYVLLPLMVLLVRRRGPAMMVALVTMPVLAVGVLAPTVPVVALFNRFTPQLAVGFALGVGAACLATNDRWCRLPLLWLAVAASLPAFAVILLAGPVWVIGHYFWVDLALMPAIGLLLAAVGSGRAPRVGRALDVGPLRSLGGFSYSLYLVHAPVVVAVATLIVLPEVGPGLPALLALLLIAVPSSLVVSRLFASAFDLPFQRHKSWRALLAAARARVSGHGVRQARGSLVSDDSAPFEEGGISRTQSG